MTTQKPPPRFHYTGMHLWKKKYLNGSIKLSCATDPILQRNKIRPQMSTVQCITPNKLLSQHITIPVCGHKK